MEVVLQVKLTQEEEVFPLPKEFRELFQLSAIDSNIALVVTQEGQVELDDFLDFCRKCGVFEEVEEETVADSDTDYCDFDWDDDCVDFGCEEGCVDFGSDDDCVDFGSDEGCVDFGCEEDCVDSDEDYIDFDWDEDTNEDCADCDADCDDFDWDDFGWDDIASALHKIGNHSKENESMDDTELMIKKLGWEEATFAKAFAEAFDQHSDDIFDFYVAQMKK